METKTVSEKEIADVETEILKKQAEEMKKGSEDKAREIEAKVRQEYELREKDKLMGERLAKIEEENKKAQVLVEKTAKEYEERMKAQEEAFVKKLEEVTGVKKGITRNESPFDEKKKESIRIVDGQEIDMDKLNYDEIERQSAEMFRRHFNLPGYYFNK